MDRLLLIVAGVYGFLGVALGAFGAHGMRRVFEELADGSKRAEWWATASHYHLIHALGIGLVAWLASRAGGTMPTMAGLAFALGVVLFSGSLYVMAFTGARWLGAITPLGGLSFLVGWALVIVVAVRLPAT